MEKRWRNLLVIVAIVAAVAVVLMLLPSGRDDFDAGLTKLNSYWASEGINLSGFDEAELNEMFLLSDSDLKTIALKANNFKGETSNNALKSLSGVYSSMANFIVDSKKVTAAEGQLSPFGEVEPCSEVALLKQRNALEDKKLDSMQAYVDAVADFTANYPAESEKAGLVEPLISVDGLREGLNESKEAVASLEGLC